MKSRAMAGSWAMGAAILLTLLAFPVIGDNAGDSDLHEAFGNLAARRLVMSWLRQVESDVVSGGYQEGLIATMFNQGGDAKADHITLASSLKSSREWLRDELTHKWTTGREELVRAFQIKGNGHDLLKGMEDEFEQKRDKLVAEQIATGAGTLFSKARSAAVGRQQTLLRRAAYPSFEEVNRLGDGEDISVKLRGTIEKRMGGGRRLFAEQDDAVKTLVDPILTDIANQVSAQTAIVEERPGVVTKDAIADFWRIRLDDRLAQQRVAAKADAPGRNVYDRLERTNRLITERAETEELKRFEEFLKAPIQPGVFDRATLEREITSHLPKHRFAEESQGALLKRHRAHATGQALSQYVALSGAGPDEADAFRRRLQTALDQREGPVSRRLEDRLTADLATVLEPVRKAITDRQVTKFFPGLNGWVVPEKVLEDARHDQGPRSFADFTKPHVVPRQSFSEEELLDETEKQVVQLGRTAVDEGKGAWDRQQALVDQYESVVKEQYLDRKERGVKDPGEEHWIEVYRNRVADDWRKDTSAGKYPNLFKVMLDQIKQKVRAFYPPKSTQDAKKEAQSDGGGKNGRRGAGVGPGEDGDGGSNSGDGGGNCDSANQEEVNAMRKEIAELRAALHSAKLKKGKQ